MSIIKKLWSSVKLSANYLKVMPQLVVGAWKIARLPQPVVSIFGGSRLKRNSKYTQWAEELSQRLVAHQISVLTGGGPGIMEAANCGAFSKDYRQVYTMGIAVKGLKIHDHTEQPINPCVRNYVETDYFAIRKFLLINLANAYVIFPGGLGTLDEFADVLTQMQTKKIPRVPVILMGTEYWNPLMEWIRCAVRENLVPEQDLLLIKVTDDIDYAVTLLEDFCDKIRAQVE